MQETTIFLYIQSYNGVGGINYGISGKYFLVVLITKKWNLLSCLTNVYLQSDETILLKKIIILWPLSLGCLDIIPIINYASPIIF